MNIFAKKIFNFAPNLYKSTVGVSFLFNQKVVYLVSISLYMIFIIKQKYNK